MTNWCQLSWSHLEKWLLGFVLASTHISWQWWLRCKVIKFPFTFSVSFVLKAQLLQGIDHIILLTWQHHGCEHASSLNVTPSDTCVRNQLVHLFLIRSWSQPVGSVKSLQLFQQLCPYRAECSCSVWVHLRGVYFSGSHQRIYFLITSYYNSKLSVQIVFLLLFVL